MRRATPLRGPRRRGAAPHREMTRSPPPPAPPARERGRTGRTGTACARGTRPAASRRPPPPRCQAPRPPAPVRARGKRECRQRHSGRHRGLRPTLNWCRAHRVRRAHHELRAGRVPHEDVAALPAASATAPVSQFSAHTAAESAPGKSKHLERASQKGPHRVRSQHRGRGVVATPAARVDRAEVIAAERDALLRCRAREGVAHGVFCQI